MLLWNWADAGQKQLSFFCGCAVYFNPHISQRQSPANFIAPGKVLWKARCGVWGGKVGASTYDVQIDPYKLLV